MMRPTKAAAGPATTSSTSCTDADEAGGGGRLVDLPLHLTEKILYHISPLASAPLATVCKSWASTISDRLTRPVPHLFVYLPAANSNSDRRGVVVSVHSGDDPPAEVIPNSVLMKDTNGLGCIGALPSGRLIFANWCWCEFVILVNPITGARQSVDVGWSPSNPLLAAGDAESFISYSSSYELVLWRRNNGGGEEWSKQIVATGEHRAYNIISVANCNGCFYMLDSHGYVFSIDATAAPPLRVEKLPVASLFEQLAPPVHVHAAAHDGHLLESGGEVLFVRRVLGRGVAFCPHDDVADLLTVVGFEVYRLDVKGQRWTEVRKLPGDRALFVSAGSSFAVRSSETEGCRSNCIYFVDKKKYCSECNRDDGNVWGVYSMEDRKVLFKQAVTKMGPCSSATWFLPKVV